jgi:ferritin-like metal-binding protein YciE
MHGGSYFPTAAARIPQQVSQQLLHTNLEVFPMSVDTLQKLFIEELKDLYSAEHQITKALPKLIKAAGSEQLKAAFESHLQETNTQIERLDKIGEILGRSLKGKTCEGMKGVLSEGSEVVEEVSEGEIRDAGIIAAAQRVEHYEMAGYGSVIEFARLLGHQDIVQLLNESLKEEKAADAKLTQVAKSVNTEAVSVTA